MRKPLVAGNWKMNKTVQEGIELINEIRPLVEGANAETVLCVPSTSLYPLGQHLQGSNLKLGAQNVHHAEFGAYTGEISALMLKELGVEYVILGHSERRTFFAENNHSVNKRTLTAVKHGIKPIICIGETLYEKKSEQTGQVLTTALRDGLEGVEDFSQVVVAYEPYWAIGTGKIPTLDQIAIVVSFIRDTIGQLYGEQNSERCRILYGGSVNPSNAEEIFSLLDVDGGLIGGASLKPQQFAEIVKAAK